MNYLRCCKLSVNYEKEDGPTYSMTEYGGKSGDAMWNFPAADRDENEGSSFYGQSKWPEFRLPQIVIA